MSQSSTSPAAPVKPSTGSKRKRDREEAGAALLLRLLGALIGALNAAEEITHTQAALADPSDPEDTSPYRWEDLQADASHMMFLLHYLVSDLDSVLPHKLRQRLGSGAC